MGLEASGLRREGNPGGTAGVDDGIVVADSGPLSAAHLGGDDLSPSTTDAPRERPVVRNTFRRAPVDMEMRQARHVTVYWILSVDPNAWADAAAVLGDDEVTVRDCYTWLGKRRASARGREKMQRARAQPPQERRPRYAA